MGYHGYALQGTPRDCLICACPLPIASNKLVVIINICFVPLILDVYSFASSCELSADGEKISCECNQGYFGPTCKSCAPGYYGRPDVIG